MAPLNEPRHQPIHASAIATTTDAVITNTRFVPPSRAMINAFLQSDHCSADTLHALIAVCKADVNARRPFDPMMHDFYMTLTEVVSNHARQLHVAFVDSAETYHFYAHIGADGEFVRRWPLKNEIARHIDAFVQPRFMEPEDPTTPTEKGYVLLRNILTDDENKLLNNPSDAEIEDAIHRRVGTARYRITDDFWLRKSDHFFYDNPVAHFVLRDGTCIEIERVSEKTIPWDADDIDRCSPLWTLFMARAFCGLDICMPAETRAQLLWIRTFGSDPNYEKVPQKVCETYKDSSVVWYKQTNRFEVRVSDAGFDARDAAHIEARANDIMRCF